MRYEAHISKFIAEIQSEFGEDFFDWIDAPEGNNVNLEHVDTEDLNKQFFEIDVGLHISSMSEDEVDNIHDKIVKFGTMQKVSVDLVEVNPESCVYKFSLHSRFLNVDE